MKSKTVEHAFVTYFTVLIGCALAIVSVWVLELKLSLTPCELCLYERVPYYTAIPFIIIVIISMNYIKKQYEKIFMRAGFYFFMILFLASATLGFYHVGVEQHWWRTPTSCSSESLEIKSVRGLLELLDKKPIAPCDRPTILIARFSLAFWNMALSAIFAFMIFLENREYSRSEREAAQMRVASVGDLF